MGKGDVTVRIPLEEAIKEGYDTALKLVPVNGVQKKLTNMDLSGAVYIFKFSFYGDYYVLSQIKGKDFESEVYGEDMDNITEKLLGMNQYTILSNSYDIESVFKDWCKYPFTME